MQRQKLQKQFAIELLHTALPADSGQLQLFCFEVHHLLHAER
jgi:hypothetical protein